MISGFGNVLYVTLYFLSDILGESLYSVIVRYSLATLCFISDWLLFVDVGELLLSEPCKYLGVSLCNFVHWCCEYICSAFGAQQISFISSRLA